MAMPDDRGTAVAAALSAAMELVATIPLPRSLDMTPEIMAEVTVVDMSVEDPGKLMITLRRHHALILFSFFGIIMHVNEVLYRHLISLSC